jgi:hypothetical protein
MSEFDIDTIDHCQRHNRALRSLLGKPARLRQNNFARLALLFPAIQVSHE